MPLETAFLFLITDLMFYLTSGLVPTGGLRDAIVLIVAALILGWWNLTDNSMQSTFNLPTGAMG